MKASVRPTSRVLWLLAACGGAAIAWSAIGLAFGSSSAHASERPTGLLDDLTSVVDSATSSVAATTGQLVNGLVDEVVVPLVQTVAPVVPAVTAPVSQAVTHVVAPVVEVVAQVPVVGPDAATLVSDTVNAATSTVGAVVDSGTALLGSNPLSTITDPLLSTLGNVPIAGDLLNSLDPLLSAGVSGVDQVLGTLGSTAADAIDPVTGITVPTPELTPGAEAPGGSGTNPDPALPEHPAVIVEPLSGTENSPDKSSVTTRDSSRILTQAGVFAAPMGDAVSSMSPLADLHQGTGVPGSDPGGTTTAPPVPTSSAGSGGGSAGALATLCDSSPQLPSAVAAASGADEDELPAAPVFDTDISPD